MILDSKSLNRQSAAPKIARAIKIAFAIAIGSLAIFAYAPTAFANSSEMTGFRFQTCDTQMCFDLTSERAAVSHIDFGFTTLTPTALKLTDASGKFIRELTGTSATYFPIISTVSLEDEKSGKTYMISLRTNRVQEFASEARK